MFKKSKNRHIKYATRTPGYEGFAPTKTVIPNWYKDTSRYPEDHRPSILPIKQSFKACVPFMDALTSGYVLLTPCDIGVDNSTDEPFITWNKLGGYEPVLRRDNPLFGSNYLLPVPFGCANVHFAWSTSVTFHIPEGYSVLYTHPLNRHDLPFVTLSAVIDGEFTMHFGQVPFFIKKDFNGVIPRGTPFAQILPFKRESWTSSFDEELLNQNDINEYTTWAKSSNWYRKTFWRKKSYL